MKLAIVLVNYNTLGDTLDCLKSLSYCKPQGGLYLKTILVDNASHDDPEEEITSRYPEIDFIRSQTNLGFAGGNNLGIKRALDWEPDWVLLLNNDTIVQQDFLTTSYKSLKKNHQVGLITPLIYFAPGYEFKDRYSKKEIGKVVWSAGGLIDWANVYASNNHVDQVDKGQFNQLLETDFATGACLFINRSLIDQIGLINEKYFLYLEDLEYNQRAKRAGWKVIFDPSIKIWHKVSQSSGIGSSLNDYFITRNRLLFGLRYASLRSKVALVREALRFLHSGRPAQKQAVVDFLLGKFGPGSWIKK